MFWHSYGIFAHVYRWVTYLKWWYSGAVLNYQKVTKMVTSLQIISSNTPHKQNTKPCQTWCTKTKCLSPAGGFNPSQEKAHCSVSSWVKNGNILEHINNWKPPISINQLCCGFCWSIHPYLSVKSSPFQATVWGPARLFSYRMIWRESWAITIHKKSWSLNSL